MVHVRVATTDDTDAPMVRFETQANIRSAVRAACIEWWGDTGGYGCLEPIDNAMTRWKLTFGAFYKHIDAQIVPRGEQA